MTGFGDEVVTRCPTCGYGLTARRYAVPKDCPLCRGSFEEAAASRREKDSRPDDSHDSHAAAHESPTAEPPDPDVAASQAGPPSHGSAGAGETTLHIHPAAVTSPLGEVTQRMPEAESKDAPAVSHVADGAAAHKHHGEQEAHAHDARGPEDSATPRLETPAAPPAQADGQETRREETAARPPSQQGETRMFTTPPPAPRTVEPLPPPHHAPTQPAPHATSQPTPPNAPRPAQTPPAAHAPSAFAKEVAPRVMNRYTDAYRVARTTVFIGNLLKVLGVVAGLIIGVTVFALLAGQSRLNPQFEIAGIVLGLFFGGGVFAFFFVLGVVISAQGQLIKATLDGAVNASPFLDEEQRAEVMSVRY